MKEQFPEEYIEINVSNIELIPSDTEIPIHNNILATQRPLCSDFPDNKKIINNIEAIINSADTSDVNLFTGEYQTISSLEDLKKILSEILIRFDTNPKHYTKSDYTVLMKLLYSTLLYLYKLIITISVNDKIILPTEDNNVDITIKTTDTDHIEVTTSDSGEVDIKAKVGEMSNESESNKKKLVTVDDIRTYIENRLAWQTQ